MSYVLYSRLLVLKQQIIKSQVTKDSKTFTFNLYKKKDTFYNNRFLLHKISEETFILLDPNQLLMLSDTMSSRYLTLLTSELYEQVYKNLLPNRSLCSSVYNWMDQSLIKYGNQGYDIIKKLEPLCSAVFLDKFDPLHRSKDFLIQLKKDSVEFGLDKVEEIISILNECTTPNQIFEIYGLYRHGGHPIVDEIGGCESMKSISREMTKIDQRMLLKCVGASKKDFIIEYIKKNKHWPNIDLDLTKEELKRNESIIKGLYLQDSYPENIIDDFMKFINLRPLNINEFRIYYPLIIWSNVRFLKTFEYNDFEDVTQLLSDTAISPLRGNWTQLYRNKLLKFKLPTDFDYSRRTLINLIKRENFSMKEIRNLIQLRKVPFNWKIIAIHSKERELKIKARLFAMMVLEMRMYYAATEKNISDTIFKYVSTQTMTNSEAELTQKLLMLTNLNKDQKFIPILVSLDFDKFNQRWRKESTEKQFEMIDDLFGTPGLYTYSHSFFEESFVCLASVDCPPDYLAKKSERVKDQKERKELLRNEEYKEFMNLRKSNLERESSTTWIGQGGGFEGLRQKGWTFCITGMLGSLEESTGIKSYIIGQGDNQFLVLMMPIRVQDVDELTYMTNYKEELDRDISRYMKALESTSAGLGMKLKLEETWCSTRLLNYGKEVLVDGCFLTSILKRSSRTFAEVNDVYPTLSKRISSIFSSCHSVAAKSFDVLIPYHLGQTLTSHMLDEEIRSRGLTHWDHKVLPPKWQQKIRLIDDPLFTSDEFEIMMLLNKEIGGYPILPISEFLYRGHPDPINCYLSTLPILTKNINKKRVISFILSKYHERRDKRSDITKIIQDPTSWNWDNGYMDTSKISKLLESNLREVTRNKEILRLMEASDPTLSKPIIEFLAGTTPFVPRVCNDIYRHSPEGAKLHYLSTFSDMKTIKEMMSSEDGNKLISEMNYQENIILKFVLKTIDEVLEEGRLSSVMIKQWLDSFTASEKITDTLWETEVIGSRVPHPLQQLLLLPAKGDSCNLCDGLKNTFQEKISYFIQREHPQVEIELSENYESELNHDSGMLYKTSGNEDIRDNLFFIRGNFTPYLGSTTREKRSRSLINFPKGERSLYAAQNLQRIRDWVVEEGSSLDLFILSLIKSRTDLPLEIIQLSAGKYFGGSVVHRFHDVITKHASRPNCRPNLFSHIYISGDEAGIYSGGRENYNIHFQSCYLMGFSLLSLIAFWAPGKLMNQYHYHFVNYSSIKVSDIPKLTSTNAKPPSVKSMKQSKILFSPKEDYIDYSYEFKFTKENILQQNRSLKELKLSAHRAAGVIIFQSIVENQAAIVQVHNAKNKNLEITACPLTINDLMILDFKLLLREVGKLLFLSNIEYIYRTSIEHNISPRSVSYYLITKITPDCLNIIRNIIGYAPLRDKLVRLMGWPTSSDFVVNFKSFEKIFLDEIYVGILDIIENPDTISEFFPYKSVTINRWIYLYFISVLFKNLHNLPHALLKYIHMFNNNYYKILKDRDSRFESLLRYYFILCKEDERLSIQTIRIPKISYFGCEPWIRLYKDKLSQSSLGHKRSEDPESKSPLPGNQEASREDLKYEAFRASEVVFVGLDKSLELWKLKRCRKKLRYIIERIEPNVLFTTSRGMVTLSDKHQGFTEKSPTTWVREIKNRKIHQVRLTGLYSTAHYKYSEMLRYIPDKSFQVSINIAEGAGGVSKLISSFFNCDKIIYNSLLPLENFTPQKAVNYVPPELMGTYYHLNSQLFGIKECLETGGDITSPETIELFKNLINKHVTKSSIMTFDAEIGGVHSSDSGRLLIESCLSLFDILPDGSYVIIKTFYYYFDSFNKVLSAMTLKYNQVTVVKPKLSSCENTEIFLIIKKSGQIPGQLNYNCELDVNKDFFHPRDIYGSDDVKSIDREILLEWHETMNEMGFAYNLTHSLKILLNGNLFIHNFMENPLEELSNLIDLTVENIRERFRILSIDLSQRKMSVTQRALKIKNLKESRELSKLGEVLINAYVLKELLYYPNPDFFYPRFVLIIPLNQYTKQVPIENFYTAKIELEAWTKLYSRHMHRVLGYLLTPNMWRVMTDSIISP